MDKSHTTLDQLRVLVAIRETGSFSAAGRSLGRVQSAISQSVKSLEAAHGIELFDRRSHRPTLTAVGEVLLEQARAVLASAARFAAIAEGTRKRVQLVLPAEAQ
jgi:DNA-binding transcriptional LysR family regulator